MSNDINKAFSESVTLYNEHIMRNDSELNRVTKEYYPTTRPILYTDTVGGKQTCVDNLWAVTTEELLAFEQLCIKEKDEEIARLKYQLRDGDDPREDWADTELSGGIK